MARTRLGRALTEDHKAAQIALVSRFYAASRVLLGELDPARLDTTLPNWAGLQLVLAESFHRDSAALAGSYLAEFRAAETSAAAAAAMPVVRPVFDAAGVAEKLALVAPMAKAGTAGGLQPPAAVDRVFWQLVAGWGRHVQAGGRGLVDESTLANTDSTGWRRVTDGHPCAWCAMLATRGPAYRTAATAGQGRRYHDRCGCTVEEVFGDWVPTAAEQRMIDAYEASHRPGMSPEETVSAMREHGQGVFNDAPAPKTRTGDSGGGGGRPPRRGMLGPTGPDEFPEFNGWRPPVSRSDIETLTWEDASILLDGDGSGHGHHRHNSGHGHSEFPVGWGEAEVLRWLDAIVDHPTNALPDPDSEGFMLFGAPSGLFGMVAVRHFGRWMIATAHPL